MKSIGLSVPPPKKSCDDPRCPFHGHLRIRGRLLRGKAVSLKAPGTAVVERETLHYVKHWLRYEKRKSRIRAHVPSCLDISEGDTVTVAECRPLTKTVSFVAVERVTG